MHDFVILRDLAIIFATGVLAQDRGIDCLVVDYAVLKGTDDPTQRLF